MNGSTSEFIMVFPSFTIELCRSIILDGEMLVWDPVSERNLPFGTLKTAALGLFLELVSCPSAYDKS